MSTPATNTHRRRRTAPTRIGISWLVLAMLLSSALTAVGCALLLPDREPAILSDAGEVTSVGVSTQQYSASRQVSLTAVSSASQQVTTSATGTVTELLFSSGTLNSGTTVMRVNDSPVIALHTDVPLYRDLNIDDTGADVRSLNRELGRLGRYQGDLESDRYSWYTQVAVQRMFAEANMPGEYDGTTLPLSMLIWMPDQSDVIDDWQARRGGTVTAGMVLGTVPGRLLRFDLKDIAASDQDRSLTIAGVTATLPAGRTSIDDRSVLDQVQRTDQYREQTANSAATGLPSGNDGSDANASGHANVVSGNITASLSLERPITVLRVPAGAVFGIEGASGCISSGGATIPISIVGSELGVSLVSLADGAAEAENDKTNPAFPSTVDIGSSIIGKDCP